MSRTRSNPTNHRSRSRGRTAPTRGAVPATAPRTSDRVARAEALAAEMRPLRLPALQAKHAELFGRPSRSKDRTGLIGEIAAELARRESTSGVAATGGTNGSAGARRRGRRGRFTDMSVEQLQALYVETLGRPTTSTDRRYLEWKLREAAKGRVTVGPIARSGISEGGEMMTLPWRIPRALVEAMDEGWRTLHFKNRSAFLAAAVGSLFESKGQRALAARFGVEARDAA